MTNLENISKEDLIKLIEDENKRKKRSFKLTILVGVVLGVVLVGYLSWLNYTLKNEILNSDNIANAVIGSVDESFPKYMKEGEASLKAAAPQVAASLSNELVNVFPLMRNIIQGEVDHVSDLVPLTGRELSVAIKGYLSTHESEIRAFYKAHDDKEFASYLVTGLLEELVEDMNNRMNVEYPGEDLDKFKITSLNLLKDLNFKIKDLSSKKDSTLTRLERQQKRLIAHAIKSSEEFVN